MPAVKKTTMLISGEYLFLIAKDDSYRNHRPLDYIITQTLASILCVSLIRSVSWQEYDEIISWSHVACYGWFEQQLEGKA